MPRVLLCCPDPPASAIGAVIAGAGAEVVRRIETLDDLLREDPECEIVALGATTPGSLPVGDAVHQLRARFPHVRVILLLSDPDPVLTGEAMKAGVYDWTVGDALGAELPALIHGPRTFADVAGGATPPAPENRADFGRDDTHTLALGFGSRQAEAVERFLAGRFPGRFRVAVREDTFEGLIRALSGRVDGVLASGALPSAGGFDLATRVALLAGAGQGAQVAVLIPPDEGEGARSAVEAAGMIAVRGERGEGGRASFPPTLADGLFRRLDQASRKAALRAAASPPAPVWGAPAAPERETPVRVVSETQVVAVASRLVVFVSPATGVGKTAGAVNVGAFAGRLGIQTLLIDQTVLPPGNAALRLGFDAREPGLELLLQGPWDEDTFQRLRLRYEKTSLHILRPISEQVVGTLGSVREGAYDDLIRAAKRQYPLVIVDTSPILDDLSVVSALRAADRVVIVLETTDDRVQQAVARVPWILRSMPDPGRAVYVVNKVGPGGWTPDEIMAALGLPDVRPVALPNEPVRHARAARAYRPIGMDAGPRDPWARLFTEVAGDIVPPERRRRWRTEPAPKAPVSPEPPRRRGPAALFAWLGSTPGGGR